MKNRISYQDFQRRQKLAEADYLLAERIWQRNLGYIKGQGVKKTILDEVKGQIAPPGSFLARFISPSKQEQRRSKSLLSKLMPSTKRPTYGSLTQNEGYTDLSSFASAQPMGRKQKALKTGLAVAKPILWTVVIGIIKGFLRRKFRILRFFLR